MFDPDEPDELLDEIEEATDLIREARKHYDLCLRHVTNRDPQSAEDSRDAAAKAMDELRNLLLQNEVAK